MKKCPFCKAEIEDNARFCLYCMKPLNEKELALPPRRKKSWWLLVLAVIIASLLIAVFAGSGEDGDSNQDPTGETSLPTEETLFVPEVTQPTAAAPATDPTTQGQTQDPTENTISTTAPTEPGTTAQTAPATIPTTQPSQPATVPTERPTQPPQTNPFTQPTVVPTTIPTTPVTTQATTPTQTVAPTTVPTTQPTQPVAPTTVPTTQPTQPPTIRATNPVQPVQPTQIPTLAPTQPTAVITQPTSAPTQPTEAITETTQPTSAPTETTTVPTQPYVEAIYTYRAAQREDDFSAGYQNSGNDIVITGIAQQASDGVYDIPSYIDGKKVIAIVANAFSGSNAKAVYVPATVKTIWNYAFADCGLTDIYFRGNVIYTESKAFSSGVTIHCSATCSDRNFRYYKNCAANYGAIWEEWNG